MANADVTLVVEKSEEKAAERHRYSNIEATMENPIMNDEDESSRIQKWKKIFVASCLIAVLLDPLFLYVPMMKNDIKCLLSDRNLKIAALLLRSLTDLFYILDIIFQIYTSDKYSHLMRVYDTRRYRSRIRFWRKYGVPTIAKIILGSYNVLIDILAILPLPQVAILIFFSEMSDLKSLTAIRMVTMNLFVLLQYVPRALRIYLSCKEFKRTPEKDIGETAKWVKGVLNFLMYILSSHVLGAICYFFAIQRMATCWHNSCRKANGCNTSTFGCHYHHTDRNITFLNDLCPISSVNTSLFDFGIYITVLQSGITGSTNYFQKFSNCFWWGLRNLSSLGSNLEPSVDGWENLFAAFISIIGLLLFLYLIGNLQTYMQLDTQRIEAHRHKMKVERKMKERDKETELWLSANGIPKRLHKDMKLKIMEKVQQELEENRDADLDKIFSILPLDLQLQITDHKHRLEMKGRETELWLSENGIPKRLHKDMKLKIMEKVQQELEEDRDADMDKIFSILPKNLQSQIRSCMPMTRLKQVPTLKNIDERVLRRISGCLKPREFDDNSIIIEKGKPLGMMVFIVDGLVSIEKRDGSSSSNDNLQQPTRGAGEVCGEVLLRWPLSVLYLRDVLLLATESAKAIGHVEALVLKASDLRGVVKMDYFAGMICRTLSANELEKATDNYQQSRIIREYEDATFYKVEVLRQTNFCLRQKIVMKVQLKSKKCKTKALKTAAKTKGVTNVSIEVEKEHVEVIGYGVDAVHLAKSLRKKLGYATIVSVGEVKKPDDQRAVVVKKYTSMHIDVAVEAAVASQTNNINVVRFLGGCVEEEKEPALIFEYIPNGTLFEHIHKEEAAGSYEGSSSSSSPTALLSLELRLKIASETAGALAYLHSLTPPIIHLCLSTKHILLDDDYTAKLSAIGQSRTYFERSDYSRQGYMDPNFQEDRLAETSDVYSFGVILAELLTSQKPASPNKEGEEPPLATCILSSMKEGRLNQILDGEIIVNDNEATSETAKKLADLAKRCLELQREERPSMEQVAVELEGLRKFMAEYQRGQPSFSIWPNSN